MTPKIIFNIRNQNINRIDNFYVVAKSKNYLTAEFNFFTQDWQDVIKTAVFHDGDVPYAKILIDDKCEVPWEWLANAGTKEISVFGGKLITTNTETVEIHESGYKDGETPQPPTPTVYEQLLNMLSQKGDTIKYSENILQLLSGKNVLSQVPIYEGEDNVIETVKVNDNVVPVIDKTVNIDLTDYVEKEHGKTLVSVSDVHQISRNRDDIAKLNGTGEGSIDKKIDDKLEEYSVENAGYGVFDINDEGHLIFYKTKNNLVDFQLTDGRLEVVL